MSTLSALVLSPGVSLFHTPECPYAGSAGCAAGTNGNDPGVAEAATAHTDAATAGAHMATTDAAGTVAAAVAVAAIAVAAATAADVAAKRADSAAADAAYAVYAAAEVAVDEAALTAGSGPALCTALTSSNGASTEAAAAGPPQPECSPADSHSPTPEQLYPAGADAQPDAADTGPGGAVATAVSAANGTLAVPCPSEASPEKASTQATAAGPSQQHCSLAEDKSSSPDQLSKPAGSDDDAPGASTAAAPEDLSEEDCPLLDSDRSSQQVQVAGGSAASPQQSRPRTRSAPAWVSLPVNPSDVINLISDEEQQSDEEDEQQSSDEGGQQSAAVEAEQASQAGQQGAVTDPAPAAKSSRPSGFFSCFPQYGYPVKQTLENCSSGSSATATQGLEGDDDYALQGLEEDEESLSDGMPRGQTMPHLARYPSGNSECHMDPCLVYDDLVRVSKHTRQLTCIPSAVPPHCSAWQPVLYNALLVALICQPSVRGGFSHKYARLNIEWFVVLNVGMLKRF